MRAHGTVVIDTNVLEAAMRSRRGASLAMLDMVGRGRFEIAISVPMILEYEEVLMRGVGRRGRKKEVVRNVLDYLCAVGRRQEVFLFWRPTFTAAAVDMVLD